MPRNALAPPTFPTPSPTPPPPCCPCVTNPVLAFEVTHRHLSEVTFWTHGRRRRSMLRLTHTNDRAERGSEPSLLLMPSVGAIKAAVVDSLAHSSGTKHHWGLPLKKRHPHAHCRVWTPSLVCVEIFTVPGHMSPTEHPCRIPHTPFLHHVLLLLCLPLANLQCKPRLPCLSVRPPSLPVDKRSTSTMNLKLPPDAGISKRLSSSSATLIKSPDKSKSPAPPPFLPPSHRPSPLPVLAATSLPPSSCPPSLPCCTLP